jgi:hypothetical protein
MGEQGRARAVDAYDWHRIAGALGERLTAIATQP